MRSVIPSNRPWLVSLTLLAAGLALLPALTQAADPSVTPSDDPSYGLNRTYQKAFGAPPTDSEDEPLLAKTLGLILNWFMGLLGFIFLMIIIYGGIGWMTAGGSEERVEKAKHQINAAIAGLIVVFISYALAEAIVVALGGASGTGPPPADSRNPVDPADT